jgi:hypothetical protein
MGSTINISVTTHCKHLCKYPVVVYLDGKARVEINKRKYIYIYIYLFIYLKKKGSQCFHPPVQAVHKKVEGFSN